MKVLIDTNIILDVLLDRAPWAADSSAVWQACEEGRITGFLPASTLTDIFYVARRATDVRTARIAVGFCLATFALCPIDQRTVEQATTLDGSDFEDNIVIACAVIGGLDAIISRNGVDFAGAPVPVLTPVDLLTQIAST